MPAEIEIPFYFSMKGLASENPAFLSKQLSSRGAACRHGKGRETPRREGKALARLPSRPSPLFADKKTNLPQGNSFSPNRRDCAPRSSPAFYRILRRLEIASARAAAPKIAASVAGSGTCVIETERAFPPNRSSYKNPSGPITETEASFAPKSEDS